MALPRNVMSACLLTTWLPKVVSSFSTKFRVLFRFSF